MTTTRVRIVRLMTMLAMLLVTAGPALAGGDWNDKQISWQTYDAGLAEAKKSNKPIVLIFYTEWCPHCTNYSKVFHDPKLVEKSKDFVMIRLDNDKEKEVAKKFALDGSYIPRTFFLSPAGVLDPELHAPREQFKFFYDESKPDQILAAMDAAQKKFKN